MKTKAEAMEHLKSMIERLPDEATRPLKFNRWLGFMQGVLWTLELRQLRNLKLDNLYQRGISVIKNILKNEAGA